MRKDEYSHYDELNNFEEFKRFKSELYLSKQEFNNVKNEMSDIKEDNNIDKNQKKNKNENKLADQLKEKLNPSAQSSASTTQAATRAMSSTSAVTVGGSVAVAATAVVAAVSVGIVPVPGVGSEVEPSPYAIELEYEKIGSDYYAFEIDQNVLLDGVFYSVTLSKDEFIREEHIEPDKLFGLFDQIEPLTKYDFKIEAHLDKGEIETAYQSEVNTMPADYVSAPILIDSHVDIDRFFAEGRTYTYLSENLFSDGISEYYLEVKNDMHTMAPRRLDIGVNEHFLEGIIASNYEFTIYKQDGATTTEIDKRNINFDFSEYYPTEYKGTYDKISTDDILVTRKSAGYNLEIPLNFSNQGIPAYTGKLKIESDGNIIAEENLYELSAYCFIPLDIKEVNICIEFYFYAFGEEILYDTYDMGHYVIPPSPYELEVKYDTIGSDFYALEVNKNDYVEGATYNLTIHNNEFHKDMPIDDFQDYGFIDGLKPQTSYDCYITINLPNGETDIVYNKPFTTLSETEIKTATIMKQHIDTYNYNATAEFITYLSNIKDSETSYTYGIRMFKNGELVKDEPIALGENFAYLDDINSGTYSISTYYNDGINDHEIESRIFEIDLTPYVPNPFEPTYEIIQSSEVYQKQYMDSYSLSIPMSYENFGKPNYYLNIVVDGQDGYHNVSKSDEQVPEVFIPYEVKNVTVIINVCANFFNEEVVYDTIELGSFTLEESVTITKSQVDLTQTPIKFNLNYYMSTAPSTKLTVSDSLAGTTTVIDSVREYTQDITSATTLTFYLQDENGQKIGDDFIYNIDPTVTGTYSIVPVNGPDCLTTFNDDESFNVYMDTQFETSDPDISYQVLHKSGLPGTPQYKVVYKDCDSRYVAIEDLKIGCECTFIVLKKVNNLSYILFKEKQPAEVTEETLDLLIVRQFMPPVGSNPGYLMVIFPDTIDFDKNSVTVKFSGYGSLNLTESMFVHDPTEKKWQATYNMDPYEIIGISFVGNAHPKNYDILSTVLTIKGNRTKRYNLEKNVM